MESVIKSGEGDLGRDKRKQNGFNASQVIQEMEFVM